MMEKLKKKHEAEIKAVQEAVERQQSPAVQSPSSSCKSGSSSKRRRGEESSDQEEFAEDDEFLCNKKAYKKAKDPKTKPSGSVGKIFSVEGTNFLVAHLLENKVLLGNCKEAASSTERADIWKDIHATYVKTYPSEAQSRTCESLKKKAVQLKVEAKRYNAAARINELMPTVPSAAVLAVASMLRSIEGEVEEEAAAESNPLEKDILVLTKQKMELEIINHQQQQHQMHELHVLQAELLRQQIRHVNLQIQDLSNEGIPKDGENSGDGGANGAAE